MLRLVTTLFLWMCLANPVAYAEDLVADSQLTQATVYTNRANLTRQAHISVPKGAHSIIVEGLPQNILTDSIRVTGTAKGHVVLGAATSKLIAQAELIRPKERELSDQLTALQDQRQLFNAEKQALLTQKRFLDNVGQKVVQKENEDIEKLELSPQSWEAASGSLHDQILANLKDTLTIDRKMRTLSMEEGKLRTELNQLRSGQRNSYQVSIPVEAAQATTLTLLLDYQIPDASWHPIYDARLKTEQADMELILYGAVQQNTGEDWKDIKLTLSTAQPHRGAQQAELGPMWVSLNAPVTTFSNKMARGKAVLGASIQSAQMDSMAFEKAAPAAAPVEIRQATVKKEGFVSEYEIPGPSTVLSDGSESKLLVGPFSTKSQLYAEVKPQLSNQAYLVNHTVLQGEAPILAGKVSLFRDEAYVGQAYIPLLRPGEEQKLAFGIDDNIAVKTRTLKDKSGEEGLIGKSRILQRQSVTTVQNLHQKPFKVVILQNTPVPRDENIKMELERDETTAGYEVDFDKVKGLLRWSKTLDPKQETQIGLGWKVMWPEGETINGLPR